MNDEHTIEQLKLALAEKERQLQVVSSLTSDFSYSVYVTKEGERKLEWTFGAYEDISGYRLTEDTTNELLLKFIHPEEEEKIKQRTVMLLSGKTVESEFRIITRSGQVKWMHDIARPEWNKAEKRVVRVIGSLRDVTQRKLAEAELLRNEQEFRNIAENIPGLVLKYKLNPDGSDELIYLSKSVEEIYEVSHYEGLNNVKLLWDRIHPDDLEKFKNTLQKSTEDLSFWEMEHRIMLPGGRIKWLWAKATPSSQEDGSIVWDTLAIDITDRKNAEEALKESEEKLLEAQNIGKIGHFEWNIKTDQLLWSDNLFSIYGLEKQEPNFELVKNIIHPGDYEFWNSKVKQALAEKKPLIIDLRMLKSNGEVIWIHNETKLLLDEHGSPDRMLGTAQDITERKKAEQALKESENLFRTLSEASPIAIGLYDPNGILKYVNPSGLKIMGAEKPNDLLGYDMFSDPFLTGENKELLRKGKNVAYESQVEFNQYPDDLQKKLNKQGIMYLHVIITPLGRDRINGYLVQMQDISDRVEAQIAVNESRKRLSLITNSVSGIIFLLKVEGAFQYRFEFINDFFFKNSGLKKEDFIGELLHDKMPPELFDQHKHYYLQAIIEKRPVKWESDNPYQMTMQKGLFNIVPLLNEEDECTHLLGIVTDITDRVRAEEALKESEERYKLLSELTFEGILIHKNGLALLVNRSFCNMVGYSEEELIGKDIVRLIVYPEDFNIIQQNIENNITTPYEIRGIKKDGTIFPAEIEAKTFYINDEKRRVAAVRDITLRKQAQKELEESEEQLRELNATKDKMLSIISHDLRNPFVQMVELSKIIGNSLQNNDLEEVKMYLSMVQRISERGHTLLMNLLDWSRNQTGRLDLNIEIFDISRVILETCDLVSPAVHRKNIELRYEPVKCMVQADKNMVTTVLRNLIGNAIKFSFPGGVVIIKNVEMNNESIIKVIDFGIGMKEEHQQMLFDLSKNFTNVGTDKEKGSGLGLILCKEFVEKNNGTLTMESEYGKGSTFSFTLPLAENQ